VFGSPKDKSAEIARAAEVKREGQIKQGRQAIDTQFAGFTPDYYAKIADNYAGFYQPQLSDQFNKARQALTYNLARSGNLNASSGAKSLGDLRTSYERNKALIGDRAATAAQQAQADVESNKGELYSQLSASADPSAAATTSAARYASLTAPPSYSPLGDIFASFLNNTGNQIAGAYQGAKNIAASTGLFPARSSISVIPS